MDPLSLNLRPESFTRFHRYFIPSAIVFGMVSIIVAVGAKEPRAWIGAATGVLLVVQSIVNWRSSRPIASTWDDNGIHGDVGTGRDISLGWNEIARMDVTMFTLLLHIKDGRTISVDLANVTYAQHKELIPRLLDAARSQGVEVLVRATQE